MAASITFYANGYEIPHTAGSGLAWYGANAGSPISVGSYNQRCYIAPSDGTSQGAEASNNMWVSSTGVVIGQSGSGILLTQLPNAQATLQVRFTNDTAVQATTNSVRIYDRYSINNNPSGITVKMAEIIHPAVAQTSTGSGDSTWASIYGSGSTLSLAPSPGCSGHYAGNGSNSTRTDTVHDWYVAASVQPDSIGAKTFGLYVSIEYL